MKAVVSFSPTKQSRMVAEYCSRVLGYALVDITSFSAREHFDYQQHYEKLVLCFPVHSQNIPGPVRDFLKRINTGDYLLIVTYGKMGTGNALYAATRILKGRFLGGAYIPSKHTYRKNGDFLDYDCLLLLCERLKSGEAPQIQPPKRPKSIFADVFPLLRGRLAVSIRKTENCNNCGLCSQNCPVQAIDNGKINKRCLRCLRCYYECPVKGLTVKYSFFLKLYLRKNKIDKLLIY
jgi:ferredoxin